MYVVHDVLSVFLVYCLDRVLVVCTLRRSCYVWYIVLVLVRTISAVECEDLDAQNLDAVSRNGSADETYNTYNTYLKYTCDSDKRMLDGATYRVIKCDATGNWSDTITACHSTCPRNSPLRVITVR